METVILEKKTERKKEGKKKEDLKPRLFLHIELKHRPYVLFYSP